MSKKHKSKSIEAKAINIVSKIQDPFQSYRGYDEFSFVPKNDNLVIGQKDPRIEAIETDSYKKTAISVPSFFTYWNYYEVFDEVVSAVELVAKCVATLGVKILKDNKEQDVDIGQYLVDGEFSFLKLFCTDYLIYGQAIPALFKKSKDINNISDLSVRLIPSHRIGLWQAQNYKITEFSWYDDYGVKSVKKDSFRLYKNPNSNSLYFGKSLLNSLYDELNALNLDQQTFNKFLENNSFPGLLIIANENLDQDKVEIIKQAKEQLSKSENHFKAVVLQGVSKVEQLRQDLSSRLTIHDKQFYKDAVYSLYGIPTYFGRSQALGGSSLGVGEQTTYRQNLKEQAVVPIQRVVEQMYNQFLLPLFFADKGYKAVCREFVAESKTEMLTQYLESYRYGVFTAGEVKKLGYGIDPDEITEEDNFRIFPSKTMVVKKGNLEEGQTDKMTQDQKVSTESQNKLIQPIGFQVDPKVPDQLESKLIETKLKPLAFKHVANQAKGDEHLETQSQLEKTTITKNQVNVSKEIQKQTRSKVFSFVEQIKDFDYNQCSMFDQFISSEQYIDLQGELSKVLKALYKVDIENYKKIEVKSVVDFADPSYDPELYELIQSQVNINLTKQNDNIQSIASSIYFFAQTGKQIATMQATDQSQPLLPLEKIQKINLQIQSWIKERINSIFKPSSGKPKPASDSIENLDNTTVAKSIIDTTVDNIYQYVAKSLNSQDIPQYGLFVRNQLQQRLDNIASNETMRSYQAAFGIVAEDYEPKQKQWLPSKASNPRQSHKKLYGEIVDYNQNYSIGYAHPNTEYRCQCGERIIF